jgi:polyferredoxin
MKEQQKRALAEVLTETVLTLLPVFALFFVFLVGDNLKSILFHEEWLFIATVLFAQSIIKLRKTDRSTLPLRHEWIDLLSVILFLLLIPCIVLLCYLSWTAHESALIVSGLILLFSLSLLSFILTSLFAAKVLERK